MRTAHYNKILVVDDTTANLQLLTDLLTAHGYRVYPASDGELALEFVRSTRPDLILLDIRMPGMDGFDVCRRLKADRRSRSIPIIFISILEDEGDKLKGFQAGAVDYISRPFQAAEVLARVRIHLELRELTEQLEHRVAERTEALNAANARLRRELAERRQANKELKASEERFQRLMDNARDIIYRMSLPEGICEYMSSAATVLSGYTPEEFCSTPLLIRKIIHPDWHRYFEKQWSGLLQGEAPPTYEYPIIHRSGEVRWWNQRNILVRDAAGRVIAIEGIVTDITGRKLAEEKIRKINQELERRVLDRTALLEAANKELEAFAYSVSHDLRAPLRHIDGFLALLHKKNGAALDEYARHCLGAISSSAEEMGLLIDNLLSFSRMGRRAMTVHRIGLDHLVGDVIEELAPDAAGRTIEWAIGDLPVVRGDASLLRIVLINLIANALKFTRTRKRARIEITAQPGRGTDTVIVVGDNGVGFDMTNADKLFGVFQRLHSADEFEGTGIGLATVRRIISRHGGRTWAEGKPDQGATFYISLPTAGSAQ